MTEAWDRRLLGLAEHIASWSKDPRRQVGAVIVRRDRTIASVGYNGFPRGVSDAPSRYEDQAAKRLMTVHAELNAILTANEPLIGHTIYVHGLLPCAACAAAIIQAGLVRVVVPTTKGRRSSRYWEESFRLSGVMLDEAGVRLDQL